MTHPIRAKVEAFEAARPCKPDVAGQRGVARCRAGAASRILLATTALVGVAQASRAPAQAILPSGGQVVSGSVGISTSGGDLTVTQTSPRAIVNWESFSVGPGNAARFVQPDAGAAILNRVTGDATSTIAGSITGNGQVYLVNPNGIAITSTGSVAVNGGFAASALDIADGDFLDGNLAFHGNGPGIVTNAGTLRIGERGFAALLGASVVNTGIIDVPLGKIGLGAGQSATLDLTGDGFLQIALPGDADGDNPLITADGSLSAARIELRAATATQAIRNTVNIPGSLRATGAHLEGGVIVIDGGTQGSVAISGALVATSDSAKGGRIAVGGETIALAGANIDASGADEGGAITIGGGALGVPVAGLTTANAVHIDAATTLGASASHGQGGNVVVWSDRDTAFAGQIRATGGIDGGSAEVSSHGEFTFAGSADLRGGSGVTGTLLLDPYNVTISTGTGSGTSGFTANASGAIINTTTLQNALATANVTVSTGSSGSENGDITVANAINWSANTTLTLDAAGRINVNAGITNSGTSSGLTLTAAGTSGIAGAGAIANSGTLTFNVNNAGAAGTLSGVLSGSGRLVKAGAGALTLSGVNTYIGTTTVSAGTLNLSGSLNIGNRTETLTVASGASFSGSGILTATTLSVSGAGSVSLTGNNAINGVTTSGTIGAFTLKDTVALSLGSITSSGPINITGSASGSSHAIVLTGATISAGSGISVISGSAASGSGVRVSGTNSLTAASGGTLTLAGTNTSGTTSAATYFAAGSVLTTNGTVSITGSSATYVGLMVDATLGSSARFTQASGDLTLQGMGQVDSGLQLRGAETLTNSGTGTLRLTGSSVSGNGLDFANSSAITLTGTTVASGTTASAKGTILGSGSSLTLVSGSLDLSGAATSLINGTGLRFSGTTIANAGSGALALSGSAQNPTTSNGGVLLTGTNSLVNSGSGSFAVAATGTTGAGWQFNSTSRLATSGTVGLSGSSASGNDFNFSGSNQLGATSGVLTLTANGNGVLQISNGLTVNSQSGARMDVAGAFSGAGALTTTGGTLNLSGVNTYSGSTVISGGTLQISGSGTLGAGSYAGTISNAGLLEYSSTADQVLSGAISGAGTLTKDTGTGSTLTLSGANTYTGTTTVAAGTLDVTGSWDLGSGTATTVTAAGATLSGTGVITAGTLAHSGAGTISLTGDNRVGAIATSGTVGAFTFNNAQSLALGSITSNGAIAITTTPGSSADLTLSSGTALTSGASGTAITLAADRGFINDAGPGALSASGGRWLVYAAAPDANIFGGLDSGNVAIWNTANHASISQSGNRYVFAYQPTLTFASTDVSKTYGADAGIQVAGAYSVAGYHSGVSGVFAGDTAATAWSGTPDVASMGSAASAAVGGGPYAITIDTGTLATPTGYGLVYSSTGTLAIGKAGLTITASDAAKTYDGLAFSGGNGVSYAGLVNGEGAGVLGGTLVYGGTAQGAVQAGSYQLTASGFTSGNYDISYEPGTLAVGKAALTITGAISTTTYDGLTHTNAFTTGTLYGADSVTTVSGLATGRDAGIYADSLSGASGSGLGNYDITYVDGTLAIGKAGLTITASDAAKTYDGLAFSGGNGVSYSGFVNGEGAGVLGGTLVYGGTAQGAVQAGSYQLTASGLTSGNYDISYEPGALTIRRLEFVDWPTRYVAIEALAVTSIDAQGSRVRDARVAPCAGFPPVSVEETAKSVRHEECP